MKKIKVCFVSLGAYPLFNKKDDRTFGGAEVQMFLLSKYLAKDPEFDVDFMVSTPGKDATEIVDGIRLYKLSTRSWMGNERCNLRMFLKFNSLLFSSKSDVFVQRSASAGSGVIRIVSRIRGKKFIYMTAHDIDCNGQFEKTKNLFTRWLFRIGIRKADLVITQSKRHSRMLKKHHKVKSIIIKSSYNISKKQDVAKLKKQGVLWVARCEDWKQPEKVMFLADKFRHIQFTMVCPKSNNQPDYFDKIKRCASKYSNIKFVKYVPFNKIDIYFQKSKIFVNTSENEGYPNTFVQAAKNGTPIVSLIVNPDNFLEKYCCGLCAYGDDGLLVKQIEQLLGDQKLYKQYSERIYEYAKKVHNINKNAKEFARALSDLA